MIQGNLFNENPKPAPRLEFKAPTSIIEGKIFTTEGIRYSLEPVQNWIEIKTRINRPTSVLPNHVWIEPCTMKNWVKSIVRGNENKSDRARAAQHV